jgi:hypothetical protein
MVESNMGEGEKMMRFINSYIAHPNEIIKYSVPYNDFSL